MSRSGGKRKSQRDISDEEAALWSHVTRDAAPLSQGRMRVTDRLDFAEAMGIEPPPRPVPTASKAVAGKPPQVRPAAKPTHPLQSPAQPFDHRKAKKIAKGRIEIDARIDLHFMRQREAHSALRSFLFDAHAKGHRTVLVITGKGGERHKRNGDDWMNGGEEPGVLKRNVPRWMAEADLAAIVAGHTTAHVRHGGEGALYVQLRRRVSPKPKR